MSSYSADNSGNLSPTSPLDLELSSTLSPTHEYTPMTREEWDRHVEIHGSGTTGSLIQGGGVVIPYPPIAEPTQNSFDESAYWRYAEALTTPPDTPTSQLDPLKFSHQNTSYYAPRRHLELVTMETDPELQDDADSKYQLFFPSTPTKPMSPMSPPEPDYYPSSFDSRVGPIPVTANPSPTIRMGTTAPTPPAIRGKLESARRLSDLIGTCSWGSGQDGRHDSEGPSSGASKPNP